MIQFSINICDICKISVRLYYTFKKINQPIFKIIEELWAFPFIITMIRMAFLNAFQA